MYRDRESPTKETTCHSKAKACSSNATCWYDWSRDCAVKITLGPELTSQSYCSLLVGPGHTDLEMDPHGPPMISHTMLLTKT